MRGFVYFIQAADGSIKVGWSRDVVRRLKWLQSAHAHKLVLLGTIRGERALEGEIHRSLSEWRISGEWFAPPTDVLDGFLQKGVRFLERVRTRRHAMEASDMEVALAAFDLAVQTAGSYAALAKICGCKKQNLHYMRKTGRPLFEKYVLTVERELNIPRFHLRPDFYRREEAA